MDSKVLWLECVISLSLLYLCSGGICRSTKRFLTVLFKIVVPVQNTEDTTNSVWLVDLSLLLFLWVLFDSLLFLLSYTQNNLMTGIAY